MEKTTLDNLLIQELVSPWLCDYELRKMREIYKQEKMKNVFEECLRKRQMIKICIKCRNYKKLEITNSTSLKELLPTRKCICKDGGQWISRFYDVRSRHNAHI